MFKNFFGIFTNKEQEEKKTNDISYSIKEKEIKENRTSLVSYGCNGCTKEIQGDIDQRYCCAECSDFDLCGECYRNELIVNYEIYEKDQLKNYSEEQLKQKEEKKQELLKTYTPVRHHDEAPLSSHILTLEMKTQFQLIHELRGKTLFETMKNAFQYYKDRPCLGYRECVEVCDQYPLGLTKYKWKTYGQVYDSSIALANSLSNYLDANDFISIYMDNCVEWYVSDFAALWCNSVVVPTHHQSNNLNLLEVLSNSDTKVISLSKEPFKNFVELFDKVDKEILAGKPLSIKLIVHKEDDYDQELVNKLVGLNLGITFKTFNEMIKLGQENPPKYELAPPPVDTVSTRLTSVSYTSGSTGLPKGVMKTDKKWNDLVNNSLLYYPNVILSYKTLSHSQRLSDWKYIYQGGRIGIYSGSMDTLFDDIKEIRPHSFWGVPRFWNLLYSQYKNDLKEYCRLNPTEALPLAKLHVRKEIKKLLGNRIKSLVTGGAPTSKEVLEFLSQTWRDINISNSYGLTEISGVCVDGYIQDNIQFRIDPVPSFNYYPTDKPYPRGELVVKSDRMSTGYYKNEDLTSQSFDGGWFKTGDIVELTGPREVNIIDRIKHAFKLANGEFVTPEPLENQFQGSLLIDQIFIHGNSLKTFLVAIIKPSIECLKQLNETQLDTVESISNNDDLKNQLINSNELKSMLYKEIERISKEKKLANYEIPKIISIDFTKWTSDNELITGSGKFNRGNLYKFYKLQIENMFITIDLVQDNLRGQLTSIEGNVQDTNGIKLIQEYLKSVLNICNNNDNNQLESLSFTQIGGDSLGAVKLSSILKEKQGINVSPQLILNQNFNLSNLSNIIQKSNNGEELKEEQNKIKINWNNEIKSDNDIVEKLKLLKLNNNGQSLNNITTKKNSNVFITGITGFLGTYLLLNLVQSKDVNKVYCLMRNIGIREDGYKKILKIFEKASIPGFSNQNIRDKIIPIVGDLSKDNFGVSDTDYQLLSYNVDLVIHNGAIVNMVLPYANMKSTNVQSTRDIIRFCLSNSIVKKDVDGGANTSILNKNNTNGLIKRLVYISTVSVFFGTSNSGEPIDEAVVPSTEYLDHGSGYNQSKLVSDILVREAASLGLPAMIFRPGTIFAHSETGYENQIDFIGLTIKGILGSKSYPINFQGGRLNLSPVDWVSSSIISIINDLDHWCKIENNCDIYHMVNSNVISLETLCSHLNSNIKCQPLDFKLWKSIQFNSSENPLYAISNIFANSNRFPGKNNIINPKTILKLKSIKKKECPSINSKMVLNYYEEFYVDVLLNPNPINRQTADEIIDILNQNYSKM